MLPQVHELKCWPSELKAVINGTKTFEFRRDDRGFRVSDVLILKEWDPKNEAYGDAYVVCIVTYGLRSGFGIPDGYVVMSIIPVYKHAGVDAHDYISTVVAR